LLKSGATGVITTHYGNLKTFADRHNQVMNAAMAYDVEQLKPLYKLKTGKPGSSFALELARNSGLDKRIIARTRELASGTAANLEELLISLERERSTVESKMRVLEEKTRVADEMTTEYRRLKEKFESKRQAMLEAAKADARRILEETNREIELAVRLIRERGADAESIRQGKEKIEKQKKKTEPVKPVAPVVQSEFRPIAAESLLPGMAVLLKENGSRGELIEVRKNKAYVAFGLVKTWVQLAQLAEAVPQETVAKRKKSGGIDWVAKHQSFSSELDLRGARGEEALNRFARWLDDAWSLGQPQLRVIHGKGDGILRKLLREHMKSLPYVKEYKNEHADLGGDGATLIYLR